MTVPRPATAGLPLRRIAILGNHLPRHCGIATFTTDLALALSETAPQAETFVLAMNDAGHRYAYPPRVRFELAADDPGAYRRAADYLGVHSADVLSVQHEFGIFGGASGVDVLPLLRSVRVPIVTTLHTILGEPTPVQDEVVTAIAAASERLVVMSTQGAALLQSRYGVPADRVDVIPHGAPPVKRASGDSGAAGETGPPMLLTFGLMSPDKGIEYALDAMPAILARHPGVTYVVLGVTHPHVVARDGEAYRESLEARARALGVADSVRFVNRFVARDELVDFLSAATICLTPYLNREQITSGALAYAVAAGKAVISTPYRYATEMLDDGRGVLVPWRDSSAIAREVLGLLGDDGAREAMTARAAARGAGMDWATVAAHYLDSFTRARDEYASRRRREVIRVGSSSTVEVPAVRLAHLRLMTDDTGLLQHAHYAIPRYADGYCLDDNARALLLMARLDDEGTDDLLVVRALAQRYLAFVRDAFDSPSGRFRNFMTFSRTWSEPRGSEDSHSRALWALGTVVGRAVAPGTRSVSGDLFDEALPATAEFTSPRAWAYALLGIDEYLRAFAGDSAVEGHRALLAERLLGLYRRTCRPEWPWFENRVTYANARLPQALIVSGVRMDRSDMVDAGLASLTWLLSLQRSARGHFAPVGSAGFAEYGTAPASFDQQPLEACGAVAACIDAHRATGDVAWLEHARCAFNWFLGENDLQLALYDATTGACHDGLHADRLNQNQGAESTLSALLSVLDIRAMAPAPPPALSVPVPAGARLA